MELFTEFSSEPTVCRTLPADIRSKHFSLCHYVLFYEIPAEKTGILL
jgi:hypothetical protein